MKLLREEEEVEVVVGMCGKGTWTNHVHIAASKAVEDIREVLKPGGLFMCLDD